jgi:hypothetical protein
MRQIWISKAGPPEILVVKEAPDPQPAAGEMRIRVGASGLGSQTFDTCRCGRHSVSVVGIDQTPAGRGCP